MNQASCIVNEQGREEMVEWCQSIYRDQYGFFLPTRQLRLILLVIYNPHYYICKYISSKTLQY